MMGWVVEYGVELGRCGWVVEGSKVEWGGSRVMGRVVEYGVVVRKVGVGVWWRGGAVRG